MLFVYLYWAEKYGKSGDEHIASNRWLYLTAVGATLWFGTFAVHRQLERNLSSSTNRDICDIGLERKSGHGSNRRCVVLWSECHVVIFLCMWVRAFRRILMGRTFWKGMTHTEYIIIYSILLSNYFKFTSAIGSVTSSVAVIAFVMFRNSKCALACQINFIKLFSITLNNYPKVLFSVFI